MIIVRLSGGIGNQLFQYALARKFKEIGRDEVFLDIFYFNGPVTPRTFALDKYNITIPVVGFWRNMLRKLKTRLPFLMETVRDPDTYEYKEDILDKTNSYLVGNWVNPKYFDGLEKKLQKEITLQGEKSENFKRAIASLDNKNSIFIHLRRGDYLKYPDKFVVLSDLYYAQAINYLLDKVENPSFFIFSDDPEYAKGLITPLIKGGVHMVSDFNLTDYEELVLMSQCHHGITANSTFSWWGAYLNSNPHKIIVSPKEFRLDKKNSGNMTPDSWGWVKI